MDDIYKWDTVYLIPKLQAEKPDWPWKATSTLSQKNKIKFLSQEVALSWSINLAIHVIKFCIFCDITEQSERLGPIMYIYII